MLRRPLVCSACIYFICNVQCISFGLSSGPVYEHTKRLLNVGKKIRTRTNPTLARVMLATSASKHGALQHVSRLPAHRAVRPAFFRSPLVSMQDDERVLANLEFDLLEGRSFRRGTLLKYGASFRAVQLRALFFASSAVTSAIYPFVYKDLFPGSEDIGVSGSIAAAASALICGLVTNREKELRGRTLRRMDREAILGELSISQPENAMRSPQVSIKSLRGKKRIVAIYGTPSLLLAAVKKAAIYKRRLAQSSIVLVAVPSLAADDAKRQEWQEFSQIGRRDGWLWQPGDPTRWNEYFEELLSGSQPSTTSTKDAWFAISLSGQSCASGKGPIVWDELLGTKLQALSVLSPSEPAATPSGSIEESLLSAQKSFYEALSESDADKINSFFVPVDDEEVSELASIGRLDGWQIVTKNDATVGLKLSSQDVTIDASGKEAFTTGIEFPQGGDVSGTLLSTQRWINVNESEKDSPEWRLAQHRTIPYMVDVDAPYTLRCDHRGCTLLERAAVPRGPAGMPGDGRA
mmetsp:Transcript_52742/g.83721  ORF Transcript_52742/g.83721 Transcript_52742/m.83721 type:complete len:521 (-) Transcript_52742:69-1631(-)